MANRWDRSRILLLGIALAAEFLVCGYFLFYVNGLKAAQAARLTVAQQEIATLRNDAGQLTVMREQYGEAHRTLAHLEPGIADDQKATYMPTFLSQLQDLAHRAGVTLMVVNPGPPRTPSNPVPPAAPANGSANAGSTAPPPPAQVQLPVNLSLKGTFAQLLAFIDGLKTFPKLVAIDALQIRPNTTKDLPPGVSPSLDINMDVSGTVLPPISGGPL